MSANSKNNSTSKSNNVNNERDVDVLYQKLGNTWFAFSIIDEEVFMSPISEEEIIAMKGANNETSRDQAA